MKIIILIILVLSFLCGSISGCGVKDKSNQENLDSGSTSDIDKQNNTSVSSAEKVEVDFSKNDADMFTERDIKTDYDKSTAVQIILNGNTATSSSESVKISDSKITITQEGIYIVSGELNDGMLVVDAPDNAKLQIVLNGAKITGKTSAALYILQADKVFLTLADGTENTLANGGSFTAVDENNIDGALFSKQDITLNGTGSLNVLSPVGHGIVCKDDMVITGGSYTINSAGHGLDANDSIRILNGDITVDAGKDALHSENSDDASKGFVYISGGKIKAEAEGDGISAGAYMQVNDGTIDLLVGGGAENGSKASSEKYGGFMGGGSVGKPNGGGRSVEQQVTTTDENSTSMKGLKSANSLVISKGNITIDSADDSIHSDVSVIINGGVFTIASGDDAIHAEDTLTVAAGKIDITKSYEGLEALYVDIKGGDINLKATDDGLNAAGGTDQSGIEGGRDGMFGKGIGGGKPGGGMSSNSNGSIKISGGTLYINASGDGLDANGTLEISGGNITVIGPTQGDTATLDYDKSGIITGGTFIGTGASGMAQSFSDSEQGVIAVNAGNQSAGTKIVLKDKNGKTIIEYTPELNFAVVILSSSQINKGEKYTITIGSESGEFEAS